MILKISVHINATSFTDTQRKLLRIKLQIDGGMYKYNFVFNTLFLYKDIEKNYIAKKTHYPIRLQSLFHLLS